MELNTYIWIDPSDGYNPINISSVAYDVESARNKLIKLFTGISDKLVIQFELNKKLINCKDYQEKIKIDEEINKHIKTFKTYNLLPSNGNLIQLGFGIYDTYKQYTDDEYKKNLLACEEYYITLFKNEPDEILYDCSTCVQW